MKKMKCKVRPHIKSITKRRYCARQLHMDPFLVMPLTEGLIPCKGVHKIFLNLKWTRKTEDPTGKQEIPP
jgi:hypothetical protein